MKQIYLDYAAATPCDKSIIKLMKKTCHEYGNPSSIHKMGEKAKKLLEDARQKVAKILNADQNEIIFVSGGTESVNLALQGVARAFRRSNKKHIITTTIEHHAVLNTVRYLENEDGFKVSYIKPHKNGIVNINDIRKHIRKDTCLISIMYANNEIGTIQPIQEIGKLSKEKGIIFHTDACQAAGFLELNVKKLNVDLMSLNGSKIYGPRGIGCLYIREETPIRPLILGGGQENNLRSGTENLPAIVGFAKALALVQRIKNKEIKRLVKLRNYFIKQIKKKIPEAIFVGDLNFRLPNNIYFLFPGVKGEILVRILSEYFGVYCSTGSACSNINPEPSHVLISLGFSSKEAESGVRFTLGRYTSFNEINYVIKILPNALKKAKEISPVIL